MNLLATKTVGILRRLATRMINSLIAPGQASASTQSFMRYP